MSLLNRSKLDIKLGEYAVGSVTALTEPLLVNRAQDYRRFAAARMIPLDADDILKRFLPAEYHVSLKIDGEFDVLVYANGEALLVNPGGTVRTGLPLLHEATEMLKKAGVKRALIAGELYFTKSKGKRPRVHDVSRVARQPASQAEIDLLSFAVFDLIELDGAPPPSSYTRTMQRLGEIFRGGKRCHVVENHVLKEASEIESQFRHWVDQGAEGAVVRSETLGLFKIKPRHTIDAAIIGFTEGTDDRVGMIHDLLLALVRPDGCLHVLGHVGGGFSVEDRRAFFSDLNDRIVASEYAEVNDQVAYRMVRPDLVIELSVLDLLSQSTRGQPINKMVLNWSAAESRYEIVRRLPMVGLISPQYLGRRDDKAVNVHDIGMRQITEIVEVPLAERDARKLQLHKSEILRREVQTKQLKGQTMVRKLVMWKTNKEEDNDEFPAYVIHFTDYSPNRKTPLEREVRISSSREQIEQLWQELATENFSKGWTPAGGTKGAVTATPAPAPAPIVEPEPTAKKPRKKAAAEPAGEEPPAKAPAKKRASTKKKAEE